MSGSRLSLLWGMAVVVGGLLLSSCRQPSTSDVSQTDDGVVRLGSVEAVDTMARAVAPSGRPLVIDGFRGRVDVQDGGETTAELRFVRRGRGQDAETARGVLEDVTITESGTQEAYTYTLETDGGAYAAVDVTGTVPPPTELTVKQSSGPVSIAGVDGALTVKHEHGPVTIRGASAGVTVEIRNGDISVQFATLPPDATVSLRTANGDVSVTLPPDASAQISAQTDAGVIRTAGLSLTEQHFSPQNAGGRYNAQLEPGEATVELRTNNGSIRIAAADTAEAVPSTPADTTAPTAPSGPPALTVPSSDTTVTPTAPPDTTSSDSVTADSTAPDGG